MGYFRQTRCTELSIIDYLTTQINANWTGVTVVKTFNQAATGTLPIVCVRLIDNNPFRVEIGSTTLDDRYGLIIDIFAKSDGQRLDLADFITTTIKEGCVYYDFSQTSGSPETLSKTANGRVQFVKFTRNTRIDFGSEVSNMDRYRHVISGIVRKST